MTEAADDTRAGAPPGPPRPGDAALHGADAPATGTVSSGRAPMSFQTKLMLTVFTIVALILVVVSAVMSLVLGRVLESSLSQQVESLADSASSWVSPGQDAASQLASARTFPGTILIVLSTTNGTISGAISEGPRVTGLSTAQLADARSTRSETATTVTIAGEGEFRIASGQVPGGVYLIGVSTSGVRATVGQMLSTIAFVTAGGLLVLGAAVTAVIHRGLRPLRAVADTATRVARLPLHAGAVSIDERVPADQADPRTEIGQVGAALNTLLDHVDSSLDERQRNEERMRRFVADASHELRTPLASIRGYSELSLRDPALSDTTGQSLERIQAQSIRMTSLVEDLLLLARLDEGTEIVVGAVDLTQVAVEALADQQVAAPDHEWQAEVPDDPVVVAGDAARLSQVVLNLLANARTHTPAGTAVTLRIAREGSGGATRAVLQVHDDGPGIDPALQKELFARFARGDVSRARKTGGTGLGLAIAKAIVEAHHGTITVRSEPGDTTFEVRLPARPA
ncbi:two-component system sensor histidine kinase TcrY [Microbacterium petrolearium]